MHWGWYWKVKLKHVSRKLCSNLIQIDSFKLFKTNALAGFIVQPLQIKAEPVNNSHLRVTYRNRKSCSYLISIDKLPCNYGGSRYYFKCPLCQERMRILYLAEQSTFLCRKCLNLGYSSQKLRPTTRYEYMNDKIKTYIKNKGGDLDLYKKPPHMNKNKYQKLRDQSFYYESKSHQAANQELRQWYGPKIEPCLDQFFDYVNEDRAWKNR